jgi:hypothetical protein
MVPARTDIEVFSLALEKARGEKLVREDLEQGVSTVSAFARHGIMQGREASERSGSILDCIDR